MLAGLSRDRLAELIDLTEAIMTVLDPAQRDKLAERIHEAALARADEPEESPGPPPRLRAASLSARPRCTSGPPAG
jgi:hypothetical protein